MECIKSNETYLAEFIEDVKIRGWSHWPIKSCEYTIYMLFQCMDKNCLDVDISDLKRFYSLIKNRPGHAGKNNVSPETIRKHFNNLASFFEFLEFEEYIIRSPVPKFRRRYLSNLIKNGNGAYKRQLISVEQMSQLVNIILDPQEKAIVCLLAKTGIRAFELISMDVDDINWIKYSIKLKPTGKRNNMTIFFDNETAKCLKRWLDVRCEFTDENEKALFVKKCNGKRITHAIVNNAVKRYAEKLGLHTENSTDLVNRFTPHCCRHWFTTHLRRAGMPREYIKELRGDSRGETIDIYDHIDEEELQRSYLAHIPQLGL